jgi:hypothetical protein
MAAISAGFAEGSMLLSPQSQALICSKRSSDSFIVSFLGASGKSWQISPPGAPNWCLGCRQRRFSGVHGSFPLARSCGCNTAGLTFRPVSLSPFDLASDYLTITC